MKKPSSILQALAIVMLLSACQENNPYTAKTDTPVIINKSDVGAFKLSPHIIREPKTIIEAETITHQDGSYMMDFERDHSFDLELLAIQPSDNLVGGVGFRIFSVPGKSTYVLLNPLNETDTINNNVDWTRITTDITFLTVPSVQNNDWSEFKFLAVKEYDQNKNSSKFYWIRLKVNEEKTGFEIESYYR